MVSVESTVRRAGRRAAESAIQRSTNPRSGHILYNSFAGAYSDNPRGICEELLRRRSSYQHSWLAGETTAIPSGCRRLPLHKLSSYREVGRSRVIVTNVSMPSSFHKRPDVFYLQTWHGTPLKRLGRDRLAWSDSARSRLQLRDYGRWDLLLSQNRFSSDIFREAFAYEGEILEVGYPRNDILNSPEAADVRREIRSSLGVDPDTSVVLYAPTFRDNAATGHGRHALSLQVDLVDLARSPNVRILLRGHHSVDVDAAPQSPQVLDVTSYPDISHLYLAADVLITDYSSVMFDYAVTGKPILFFTPDLDEYRDRVRGFYFDLESEAPGPICRTQEELSANLAAIIEAGRPAEADKRRYSAFRAKYCYLDDGRAAARVADRIERIAEA